MSTSTPNRSTTVRSLSGRVTGLKFMQRGLAAAAAAGGGSTSDLDPSPQRGSTSNRALVTPTSTPSSSTSATPTSAPPPVTEAHARVGEEGSGDQWFLPDSVSKKMIQRFRAKAHPSTTTNDRFEHEPGWDSWLLSRELKDNDERGQGREEDEEGQGEDGGGDHRSEVRGQKRSTLNGKPNNDNNNNAPPFRNGSRLTFGRWGKTGNGRAADSEGEDAREDQEDDEEEDDEEDDEEDEDERDEDQADGLEGRRAGKRRDVMDAEGGNDSEDFSIVPPLHYPIQLKSLSMGREASPRKKQFKKPYGTSSQRDGPASQGRSAKVSPVSRKQVPAKKGGGGGGKSPLSKGSKSLREEVVTARKKVSSRGAGGR
ncbi:hypothetical protein IE53DRAFT_370641 [Violaceomyces palustris]|uniref:Uncharacterized protein n=1 Tax=Violaceomyces palustris TaxID=1673888 RepID=A0ACD0NRE7_9BASI|nr:hypothetical protein IE53DRAFT_370641 [Violaceomyces palustris]